MPPDSTDNSHPPVHVTRLGIGSQLPKLDYEKGYDLGYQDAKEGLSALTLYGLSDEYVQGYKKGYEHGSI